MTLSKSRSAKRRYHRDSLALCPSCHGSGRVLSSSTRARATRGGNSSYLASLGRGRLSMSDRGRLGGRPKEPTLEDLRLHQSESGGMGLTCSLQEDGT